MKILIVEDISRWEQLIVQRLGKRAEISVVRSIGELEKMITSGQKFFAVALDGWLGGDSTLSFVPRLLGISQIVISTSYDVRLRKKMIKAGCHRGGNKWDFVDLITEVLLQ